MPQTPRYIVHAGYTLAAMQATDIDDAVGLIARAMDADEGNWARKTMNYHFSCMQHGLDDGRQYFVWKNNAEIAGLVGLHHYHWGPAQNVWLSWFAVAPLLQRRGHGRALLQTIEAYAFAQHYRKFLVETYASVVFAAARSFYIALGFSEVGRIAAYLDDGSDMVVYAKVLGT